MTSTRDSLINAIEKLGWHLTPESVDDFLKENKNLKQNDLTKIALDCDLKNIGAKHLPDFTSGTKIETFEGPCVLQLVKIRNIAAPKENENSQAAPPLYRLTLTDGVSSCNALVVDEPTQKLNLNTPPGTKLLVKDTIKLKSNLLMLNNTNMQVLGGHVDYLVSKWKTNKELQQHVRVVNLATAPPAWVPFGVKQTVQVDTSKKVFAQADKQAEDETSEFSQARQAALAEAMEAKLKITKTFAPQTIDKSQIKTESEPVPVTTSVQPAVTAKPVRKQGKGRRGRNFDQDDEDDYKEAKDAAKPSAVTLFDMVKNHLDIKEPEETSVSEPVSVIDNNQRRGSGGGRGGRGGGRGGGRNQAMNRNSANRQQYQQQSQQAQQIYDKDDFSYDLGDTTKVKDLVKIPKMNANSQDNENKTQQQSQTQETGQSNIQSYNNNKPRQDNRNFNNNRQNSNNSQFNQQRNYNNQNNYNNNNNQSRHHNQNNNNMYQQDQQHSQPMNYYQDETPNFNNSNNNQRPYQQPQQRQPKFINWRIGDECLARHPSDNKVFSNCIVKIHSILRKKVKIHNMRRIKELSILIQNINYNSNMCLVNFIGYNEYYEFYLQDLVPHNNQFNNNMNNNYRNYNNNNNSSNTNNNNKQNRRY